MTVREIARQAGVSAATVSRYFTGTEKVSEDVRCKIQSVLGDDVSSGKRSRHKKQANGHDCSAHAFGLFTRNYEKIHGKSFSLRNSAHLSPNFQF